MDIVLAGGGVRMVQGMISAIPTLVVGLCISAVLRYYLGISGTLRLFGGAGWRSLAQSWLVGMLLPVCSIGVIPIIREMRRMGIRPGAITAFALSAPLFNPLSLLYGLTLSRPVVIIGFALCSLLVVTTLGWAWDCWSGWRPTPLSKERMPMSFRRLNCCGLHVVRELWGPTGLLALVALCGLFVLGALLPHGALQESVEANDPWAPLTMAVVAVPIFATPMLTMSQLGMMFSHGNSPGAALCLLLLGTGINIGTLYWIVRAYGFRAAMMWFGILVVAVVGCAYAINQPLMPPGIDPAGHTHAFDIYTNPFHSSASGLTVATVSEPIRKSASSLELRLGLAAIGMMLLAGGLTRTLWRQPIDAYLAAAPAEPPSGGTGLHRPVPAQVVALTGLTGLVALSIVACYAYYPHPRESLEEMRIVRVEVLSAVTSRDFERILHFTPELQRWSRMLEVGYFLRHFEIRPYQRMQGHLLRKKLELLEHLVEDILAADESSESQLGATSEGNLTIEHERLDQLRQEITFTSRRLSVAYP